MLSYEGINSKSLAHRTPFVCPFLGDSSLSVMVRFTSAVTGIL